MNDPSAEEQLKTLRGCYPRATIAPQGRGWLVTFGDGGWVTYRYDAYEGGLRTGLTDSLMGTEVILMRARV